MKKVYFLTAVFENKFGKAKKYFDGKDWHWMLNSDKPQLYETVQEATEKAQLLEQDDLMDLSIKEVNVYEEAWEHKISSDTIHEFLKKNGQPKEVLFYQEHKKYYLFLSLKKQMEEASLIDGLYCVDRKTELWIYCTKKAPLLPKKKPSQENVPFVHFDVKPEDLIVISYQKLKEVKALMILLEEKKSEIDKIDIMMMLMRKTIPATYFHTLIQDEEEGIESSPQKIIHRSFEKLEEAKTLMGYLNYEEEKMEKINSLLLFHKRLL